MEDTKIGIDIGSTATKVAFFSGETLTTFIKPTGWSGAETAERVKEELSKYNIDLANSGIVATGYGRISVPYAQKHVTEITCHAKGVAHIYGDNATIIDIGGQDTKVIDLKNGMVNDFMMNDKCSAGTGKFLEVMATRLAVDIPELCCLASTGENLSISSMCTVFAESEIISFVGRGEKKADIAFAIIDSILDKVVSLVLKQGGEGPYYLTGGLCDESYVLNGLEKKLKASVKSSPYGRFAGAIGAALLAPRK